MNLSPAFKLLFSCAFFFTFLALVGIGLLAFFGNQAVTESAIPVVQRHLSTACDYILKAGLGAIFGLFGGKLTK